MLPISRTCLAVLPLCALLAACGEQPAETFADHLDSGDFKSAYAMTTDGFRKLTSEGRFVCAMENRGFDGIGFSDLETEDSSYGKSYKGILQDKNGRKISLWFGVDKEGAIVGVDSIGGLGDSKNVRFGSSDMFVSSHLWPGGC